MITTIITPTLNPGERIHRLLGSVARQTIQCEHLIVDGGSTDGTRELVAQYPHATWIDAPGTSIYEAQNIGIQAALGDWIYFAGADDVIYEFGTMRAMLALAEVERTSVVQGRIQFVTQNDVPVGPPNKSVRQQSFLYAKSLYRDFGVYDTSRKVFADVAFQRLIAASNLRVSDYRGITAIVMLGGYSANSDEEYPT